MGGELKDFNPSEYLSKEEITRYSDINLQYGLSAARQAIKSSGIVIDTYPAPSRVGLVVGTCNGGLRTAEKQYEIILGKREGLIDAGMILLIRYHALGKALAFSLGIRGPTWIVATACSSSTGALGIAYDLIMRDVVDVVIVGGSDSLCLSTMAGFDAIRATSTGHTAPFSMPVGLNLGEGAAFWVMEDLAHATSRGAHIEGEVLGYATTADAHHPTAPDPRGDGAFRTMTGALKSSNIEVDALGCINGHGTGTDANDRVESKAVARLIGNRNIPLYSFKSQVGHCLGAAGIIEATAGLLAMQRDTIPATINFNERRAGCHLNYVPNTPLQSSYDHFLSCNYAFGGNNAGVVVAREVNGDVKSCKPKNAVITGANALTSLGVGLGTMLEAMRGRRRGISKMIRPLPYSTHASLAGLVPEVEPRDIDRRLDLRSMNPISRYATIAGRLTLTSAGLRVSPREGIDTGIVNGVYVGPSEEEYMTAVVGTGGREADIGGFSQIVANATAGWVSNALQLRGYSTTIAQGADAGLFALLCSHLAVVNGEAIRLLAGAADELYPRYYVNYDDIGFLYSGEDETRYRIRLDTERKRVLGEGAAYLMVEEEEQATHRNATIWAAIMGYGMTTDNEGFFEACTHPENTASAIETALANAGWDATDVGTVLWTPQGNRGDQKVLSALDMALGSRSQTVPLMTSVFNTGLMESASGTATLAGVLAAWQQQEPLWPQITGLEMIDRRELPDRPVNLLVVTTSEIGFNLALAISPKGLLS